MAKESGNSKQNQGVIKSAIAMSSGTLGSRVLGLVRETLIGSFFGRTVTDAFYVAFTLPNMFRRLLGEGSLSVSFIPIYLEARGKGSVGEDLASSLWVLLLTISSVLSVFGIIFMPDFLKFAVGGEGFINVPGKLEITVLLARVMFLYLFFVTSYGYLMAICQAWKKFFLPALAPAFFNLVVIIFMFVPATNGLNLAMGVLVGGIVQLALVVYQLKKLNKLPAIKWCGFSPELNKVLINMLPGFVGLGVMQLITFINLNLASRLSEGSHSYLNWANRIIELPQSLIAISLGAALLPTLSELWSQGERKKMLNTLFDNIQVMLFLALPSAIGVYLLGLPIIQMLFQRYKFTAVDSQQVMLVLQVFSLLLLVAGFVRVFVNGFYAVKNTWFPAVSSSITLVCHFALASVLTDLYGLRGLAFATVISAGINMIVLLIGFYFLVERFSITRLLMMPIRFIPPSIVLYAMLYFFQAQVDGKIQGGSFVQWVYVLTTILMSVVVYFAVSHLFKVKEAQVATGLLKRKLFKA